MDQIAFTVQLASDYNEALPFIIDSLKAEGFGVITEVDVKTTLKKKLDQDFRRYIILGACNPPLAHKALETDPLVGLVLPCNVTVEENQHGTLVNLVNPEFMLLSNPKFAENPALKDIARDASERFTRVAKALKKA
jgi:uncharacterized protein (DUF302 family)